MANEIGPLAVKAVVNPKGIDEGLDQVKGKLRSGTPGLAEEAGKAGDAAGKSLGSRFASAAKWGLAGAAGAGLLGGASLAASYAAGASYIRDIGNAAKAASVPMAEFQSVAWAFGKNEDAVDGLVKLNAALSRAVVLGENAGAFTSLGLDPAKLLAGGGAYEQVADRIAAMGSAWQQGFAAQRIWGEEYKKFLPTLAQGGQFIREQRDLLAGFGATAGEGLFGAVRTADRLFNQFSALKQGFLVQVTEGLAPLLAALAEKLPRLHEVGLSFKGFGEGLRGLVEGASKFGVGLFEAFRDPAVRGELFGLFDRLMKYAGEKFSEYLMLGVGKLFTAIGSIDLGRILGRIDLGATGERLLLQSRHHGSQSGGQLGMAGARWSQLMDVVGQTSGGQWLNGLFGSASLAQAGQDWAAVGRKLAGHFGASGLLGLGGPQSNALAIAQESAANLLRGAESPLEKFREQWLMLDRLRSRGAGMAAGPLAMIAGEEGDLMRGRLFQQLRQQFGSGGQSMLSGALQQGTAGAVSAINQGRFSGRDDLTSLLQEANRQRELLIKLGQEAARDPALEVFLKGK